MPARKRGRPRKYARKPAKRRAPLSIMRVKRTVISPMAHLARKVQGIDTRLHHVESEVGTIPTRYVRRRVKEPNIGSLEAAGSEYWASGE